MPDDRWRDFPKTATEFARRGTGSPYKELFLVAAEADGRARLAHADNDHEGTLKSFADRRRQAVIQSKRQRRESNVLQGCHWTTRS
jgi:hypothetical protein